MGRREIVATITVSGFAGGATVAWLRRPDMGSAWTTPMAAALQLVSVWALVVATVVMVRWRPASRLWKVMAALSVARSWFVVAVFSTIGDSGLFNPRGVVRPVLFFLLLAWPSGHLRRADRTWWAIYSVVQAFALWIAPQLFEADDGRLFVVADMPVVVEIARSFLFAVVLPVGAAVLYLSVRRHADALPAVGRRLQRPIVMAAAVIMVSELVLVLSATSGTGFDEDGRPHALGGLFLFVNVLPYATTPVLAIVAVRRSRPSAPATTSIEIGTAESVLHRSLLTAGGDALDVRFTGPGGSRLDRAGRRVPAPTVGTAVVEIRRGVEVLATVTTDGAAPPVSPDEIEQLVAAAGASVDFARLAATANAGRRDASDAHHAMVEARDAAMERLERDLHDGAQQRLVGLALQASMARRFRDDDASVAEDLRAGIAAARKQLSEAASGLLPSVVGARGLEASIAALAACAATHVEVDVDLPAELPVEIAAAAWFVAAESVANATKHAAATRLLIAGSVVAGDDGVRRLDMVVDDDGRGGADLTGSGFMGLHRRVERFGGDLDVSSPVGVGTVVRATFPLPAEDRAAP